MTSEREEVECDSHGTAYEAWVCEHLFTNPEQEWYSSPPSDENPWPDAWCEECDKIFLRDGEWNEQNSSALQIKLICNFCYEDKRKKGWG